MDHPCTQAGQPSRPQHGFTLVELLATLAVAAILLGIGLPPLRQLAGSMGTSSASNELLAGLFLARSEAIKRRGRVTLCKSSDGAACSDAGGWEQGWIVFVDHDGDGHRGAGEAVLQRRQALAAGLRVSGNASLARYVAYTANGSTRLVGGGFQAGTLTVCQASTGPVAGRQIVINANGRPRVQKALLERCA